MDAYGAPTIDPTKNVLDHVAAAIRRQDDLRELQDRLVDAKIDHLSEVVALRATHAKEVRELESDRLDKLRQFDVLAGNTAADRALVAIQTLATSQAGAAETLRAMVSTQATTLATQLESVVKSINDRIAMLEKSSYEGKGRQSFADPAMAELLAAVTSLRESRAMGAGRSGGLVSGREWAGWVAGLIAIAVSIFFALSK